MSVLTVASSKGGPGKTTVCQVLAGSLASKMKVVVLDADPTEAMSRWASNAYEGPPFEAIKGNCSPGRQIAGDAWCGGLRATA